MDNRIKRIGPAALLIVFVFLAGMTVGRKTADPIESAVVSEAAAASETFDWGTLHSYYMGETYGTTNGLAAVADIKPGMQIHPPHRHTEEEYMLVTQGEGTWHLNGEDFEASAGDMLYAAPWDIHGIQNTGSTELRFVVWKWDNKGVERPIDPEK